MRQTDLSVTYISASSVTETSMVSFGASRDEVPGSASERALLWSGLGMNLANSFLCGGGAPATMYSTRWKSVTTYPTCAISTSCSTGPARLDSKAFLHFVLSTRRLRTTRALPANRRQAALDRSTRTITRLVRGTFCHVSTVRGAPRTGAVGLLRAGASAEAASTNYPGLCLWNHETAGGRGAMAS